MNDGYDNLNKRCYITIEGVPVCHLLEDLGVACSYISKRKANRVVSKLREDGHREVVLEEARCVGCKRPA